MMLMVGLSPEGAAGRWATLTGGQRAARSAWLTIDPSWLSAGSLLRVLRIIPEPWLISA